MEILHAVLRSSAGVALVIVLTRACGLRTFSKMSAFDFALTLAVGSTLAGVAMADTRASFVASMAGLVALYALQAALGRLRERVTSIRRGMDNEPLLLMQDGKMCRENMVQGKVSEADIMSKLREANALRLDQVRAVVLETTGDVSVLHGEGGVDDALLEGVRR